MKKCLPLLAVCGLVFVSGEARAWQSTISGTAGDGGFVATAVDGSSNVVAVGSLTNTDTGADFAVVKFDGATGAELWRQAIDGTGHNPDRPSPEDSAVAVAVDGVGGVVAGGQLQTGPVAWDFTVIKFDGASGAELWRRSIHPEADSLGESAAHAVAADGAGNVVAAGYLGSGALLVIKFDGTSGAELWRQSPPYGGATTAALDGAGNVVVGSGGGFVIKFDGASGAELWHQSFPSGRPYSVAVDGAGDVAAAGYARTGNDTSFAVMKFEGASGAVLWRAEIVGFNNTARSVGVDAAGDVVATGYTADPGQWPDFTVAKFKGADGTELWRQRIAGTGGAEISADALGIDAAGNVVAAGDLYDAGTTYDFTVIKFHGADGTELWRRVMNGAGSSVDAARALALDGVGNVVAAGTADDFLATVVKLRGTNGGDVEPPLDVAIDIRPGESPNTISLKSQGKLTVAVLSSASFAARDMVDRSSLTFGRTGDEQSLESCDTGAVDVNGDGLPDLVCRFLTAAAGFEPGDTEGVLKGSTADARSILGGDSVTVVGSGAGSSKTPKHSSPKK